MCYGPWHFALDMELDYTLFMGLEYFPLKRMDIPGVNHPRTGNKLSLKNKDFLLISAGEAVGHRFPGVEMPKASCWWE